MNTKNAKYAKLNANGRQLENLMRAFIATRKGDEVTASGLCFKAQEIWGIKIDPHDWSDLLEQLNHYGVVTHIGFSKDREETYIIN